VLRVDLITLDNLVYCMPCSPAVHTVMSAICCTGSRETKMVDPELLISVADRLCCCLPHSRRAGQQCTSVPSLHSVSTTSATPSPQPVQY